MESGGQRRATLIGSTLVLLTLCCCGATLLGWLMGGVRAFSTLAPQAHRSSTLHAPAPPALEVRLRAGELRLVADETDEVRVEMEVRAPQQEAAAQVAARLESVGQGLRLSLTGDQGEGVAVRLIVHLPPTTTLTVVQGSGRLTVEGLAAPLTVALDAGRLRLSDYAAQGEITIRGEATNVDLALRSLEEGSQLRVEVESGSLAVALPASVGFALDATTGSGEIQLGGFAVGAREEAQPGPGHTLRGLVEPARERRVALRLRIGDILLRSN